MTDRERLLEQVENEERDAQIDGLDARRWMIGKWFGPGDNPIYYANKAAVYAKAAAHHALTAMALRTAMDCVDCFMTTRSGV